MLYPELYTFRNKGAIKTFSDIQNMKKNCPKKLNSSGKRKNNIRQKYRSMFKSKEHQKWEMHDFII